MKYLSLVLVQASHELVVLQTSVDNVVFMHESQGDESELHASLNESLWQRFTIRHALKFGKTHPQRLVYQASIFSVRPIKLKEIKN